MLIKNGKVFQKDHYEKLDILIEGDKIVNLSPEITVSDDEVIDAQGKIVNPGFIDVHVHFREPGQTDKETILTGSQAAAKGGYTTVGAMPNVIPVPDTSEKFQIQQILNQQSVITLEQYAPITTNEIGDELVDFERMQKLGAFAFSNDGHAVKNSRTMLHAMKEIAKINSHLAAHIEDVDLFNHGVINKGKKSAEFGLPGISEATETAQLARDLVLAKETGVHYHASHISTKTSVEMIRSAKNDGINVTCEVTPHHLLLCEDDIKEDNAMYKMNPPLRTKEDQAALIAGLQEGVIDMIATDHAPHTMTEKTRGFLRSSFGISGIETAFSLLFTKLVKTETITLEKLIQLMSVHPVEIFDLPSPEIQVGNTANLNIIDLEKESEIQATKFISKGKNTPFDGVKVSGQVTATICNGQIVYGG
ncbi:dihydroorotase [Lactobacillus sp. YT155]|uniref:dihydroorotase n=1 Tax=Lactobacillus sp. YT155 TaxID=3060955 RepID=UPI00265E0B92|nr:dihydroorotase [Lactobacillus sp. YT155]MDO1604916.1 dihydroorotase [Lactobacillus sp. YT155]